MTYDRGLETAEHKILTEETGVKVYFADPNSRLQIVTIENTNGLIRDYYLTGTDFRKVTIEELKFVQNQLNNRPRKILNRDTPKDSFKKLAEA